MKKLLGIVVLVLMISGNSYANDDLTGKKLICKKGDYIPTSYSYKTYNFESDKNISVQLLNGENFKIIEKKYYYRTNLKTINIYLNEDRYKSFTPTYKIDRETLFIRHTNDYKVWFNCTIIGDDPALQNLLETILEEMISDQKAKNQI